MDCCGSGGAGPCVHDGLFGEDWELVGQLTILGSFTGVSPFAEPEGGEVCFSDPADVAVDGLDYFMSLLFFIRSRPLGGAEHKGEVILEEVDG